MTDHEFDILVARLQAMASRRSAVKGVVGGALASLGIGSSAGAQKKGRVGHLQMGGKAEALENGKREACSCTGTETVKCKTVQANPNTLKKILRHPDSHRGPCEETTTTTTTTTTTRAPRRSKKAGAGSDVKAR